MHPAVRKAVEKQAEYAFDGYTKEDLDLLFLALTPEEKIIFERKYAELVAAELPPRILHHRAVVFILREFAGLTVEQVGRFAPKEKKRKKGSRRPFPLFKRYPKASVPRQSYSD